MEGGNQSNRFSVFQKGLGSIFKVFQKGLGSILEGLGAILAPFRGLWAPSWLDFGGVWLHVGTILALCWTLWAQELELDGLVGLREASRL